MWCTVHHGMSAFNITFPFLRGDGERGFLFNFDVGERACFVHFDFCMLPSGEAVKRGQ